MRLSTKANNDAGLHSAQQAYTTPGPAKNGNPQPCQLHLAADNDEDDCLLSDFHRVRIWRTKPFTPTIVNTCMGIGKQPERTSRCYPLTWLDYGYPPGPPSPPFVHYRNPSSFFNERLDYNLEGEDFWTQEFFKYNLNKHAWHDTLWGRSSRTECAFHPRKDGCYSH